MSIARRLVGFGIIAVLSLSSCYDKSTRETLSVEEDASDEGQIEVDQNDASGEIEKTRTDAAGDSAIETNTDALTNNRCRVVKPIDDALDDAGVIDLNLSGPPISGIISINGECLSSVEVCLSYQVTGGGLEAIEVYTNQYGRFDFSYRPDYYPLQDGSGFSLTPRKNGYRFDPPLIPLNKSDIISGVEGLSISATQVALPSYATGQWIVIEDACELPPGVSGEMTVDLTTQCYTMGRLEDQSGDLLTFENGCLFGGIGCVDGLNYSDHEAFCRRSIQSGMLRKRPVFTSGEYEEESQTWRISRTIRMLMGLGGTYVFTKRMLLERAP